MSADVLELPELVAMPKGGEYGRPTREDPLAWWLVPARTAYVQGRMTARELAKVEQGLASMAQVPT